MDKKLHLVKWATICTDKKVGGLVLEVYIS